MTPSGKKCLDMCLCGKKWIKKRNENIRREIMWSWNCVLAYVCICDAHFDSQLVNKSACVYVVLSFVWRCSVFFCLFLLSILVTCPWYICAAITTHLIYMCNIFSGIYMCVCVERFCVHMPIYSSIIHLVFQWCHTLLWRNLYVTCFFYAPNFNTNSLYSFVGLTHFTVSLSPSLSLSFTRLPLALVSLHLGCTLTQFRCRCSCCAWKKRKFDGSC